jgi:ABC-type transport system involved in cytochrome c biogenesis permease component
MLRSVNGVGLGRWGVLALVALVASPVYLMLGDPVHSVWIIGVAAILVGTLALSSALRR